jgi:hypothetical protein
MGDIRSRLSAHRFTEARDEGKAIPLEQAIAYALDADYGAG